MKKTQSSLEFLLIFAIGFSIILILSGLFFTYSSGAKKTLDQKQLESIGQEIISNVEKIYFLGEGNKVTLKSTLPDAIENITIHHRMANGTPFEYLNISYFADNELRAHIFTPAELYIRFNCTRCYHNNTLNVSYFNDTSDFSGGPKNIQIESQGDWVSIDFKK